MTSLEERFVAAVEALDRPDRDLVGPVLAAVAEMPPVVAGRQARPAPRVRPRPWAMALVSLAVAVAVVTVVAPARQAVAHWLGIGATRVVVEPGAGTGTPSSVPTVTPSGGSRSATSSDPVDVIAGLGRPGAIVDGPGRARTYRWPASDRLPPLADPSVGAQLTVRPADGEVVTKLVDPAVEIVFVEIPGRSEPTMALWIGGQHERDAPGGSPELAQQVLVWVDSGIEYRLEADLDLAAVLALAAEIEPGTRLLAPG